MVASAAKGEWTLPPRPCAAGWPCRSLQVRAGAAVLFGAALAACSGSTGPRLRYGHAPAAVAATWLATEGDDAIAIVADRAPRSPKPPRPLRASATAGAQPRRVGRTPGANRSGVPPRPLAPDPAVAKGPTPAPEAQRHAAPAADPAAARRVAAALRLLTQAFDPDRPLVDEVLAAAGERIAVPRRGVYEAELLDLLRGRGGNVPVAHVRAGDIAFFRDTLDVNGNRLPDDGVTLAAIVERVEEGRWVLIARRAGRVRRIALDPGRPTAIHDDAGRVINTRLVQWPGQAQALTTGQLLAAIARP